MDAGGLLNLSNLSTYVHIKLRLIVAVIKSSRYWPDHQRSQKLVGLNSDNKDISHDRSIGDQS